MTAQQENSLLSGVTFAIHSPWLNLLWRQEATKMYGPVKESWDERLSKHTRNVVIRGHARHSAGARTD